MSINDKKADLTDSLRYATGKVNMVIVTGGLGPTDNDITRETLSDFTEITLKEHPDVLKEMARRFRVTPDRLRANLRRQTQVPTQGTYFRNSAGTAVGLVFETNDAVIVALPGPPRELQAMVRNELLPYLSSRFGTRLPGCSLTLRFVGPGQSQIDQSLEDNIPMAPDIMVSSQFEAGRVDFTFLLPEDTRQNRARLLELKQKIMQHLGEYVYADDETSLEEHVLKLLKARGEKLALAEAGSGGILAATLCNADKNGQVLAGAYIAPNTEKLAHLLGIDNDDRTGSTPKDQRVKRLAAAVADATASQWAIAVGEIQRNTNGSGRVQVAFKPPDNSMEIRQVRLYGTGENARSRLSTQLLDQLRRRLK
jgi:nicotinamide-nucleotide amidase